MILLHVPVPETVTAEYLVPLEAAVTVAEARQRIIAAVGTHVTGPLQTLILHWIREGTVALRVMPASKEFQALPDEPNVVASERLTRLNRAAVIVSIKVTGRTSLIAKNEWAARGSAAALAASIGAPLVDAWTQERLDAQEALAALPDMTLPGTPDGDLSISFSLQPWVQVISSEHCGTHSAVTSGMCRFGLPEFIVGGCERDLQQELKEILFGLVFRVWSDLIKVAQATPNAIGLTSMPRFVDIPAEMDIHRRDLDRARGVPNRGGCSTTISLELQLPPEGPCWLMVCPPVGWDLDMEFFVGNLCHAMFGFEKPIWYYLPQLGAALDEMGSLPKGR